MNVIIRDGLWPNLVAAVNADWPAADWPGWVTYDPATQCKRASNLAEPLPAWAGLLLARMAAIPTGDIVERDLIPDLGMWGAGLHEMPPGPGLASHLDADTHARLGIRRVLSAVLYVHDQWQPSWGGKLEFASGIVVSPAPGRLVVFDCLAEQHMVREVTCPSDVARRSLAMFWYQASPGHGKRPRAEFRMDADEQIR